MEIHVKIGLKSAPKWKNSAKNLRIRAKQNQNLIKTSPKMEKFGRKSGKTWQSQPQNGKKSGEYCLYFLFSEMTGIGFSTICPIFSPKNLSKGGCSPPRPPASYAYDQYSTVQYNPDFSNFTTFRKSERSFPIFGKKTISSTLTIIGKIATCHARPTEKKLNT